jgi:hypothetical protein
MTAQEEEMQLDSIDRMQPCGDDSLCVTYRS